MLTVEYVQTAIDQADLEIECPNGDWPQLVRMANRELRAWGHDDHRVAVERISPYFGEQQVLNWSLWCETCHVSHHVLLSVPFSQAEPEPSQPDRPERVEAPSRRRWSLRLLSFGLIQRIQG